MDINELWQKMQNEFDKQNERLDKIEVQVAKIPEIERQVAKIPEIEKQVAKIPGMKQEIKSLNSKVSTLSNRVSRLEDITDKIDKKLDDTININIAKILNEQTAMRIEMNAKFNMLMLKHDRDYKKLEYQIAKLANDTGMNYLV